MFCVTAYEYSVNTAQNRFLAVTSLKKINRLMDVAGFDWNLVFKWDFMSSAEIAQRRNNVIAPIRFVFHVQFLVMDTGRQV